MKKVCIKCKEEKELLSFHKHKNSKDGHINTCKICKNKIDRDNIKKYLSKEINIKKINEYRNSLKYKEYRKKYLEENKERINQQRRKYKKEYRKKEMNNPFLHIKKKLRGRIAKAYSVTSWNKHNTTKDILGCDFNTAFNYLEKQFKDGMSWDNRSEWHIDHIIPLDSAKTEEELLKLCHYTNLQPLWAIDNLRKSNKI
jgi:hypothetical protein